ncbi:MAG: hypothetical protein MI867_11135, partial [Pseudomonadales bacterium]|nr:hypothetical protein [Pseudomonadales bacterium]
MAIAPLRKITLLGLAEERELWLEPLQSLGVMHVEENLPINHVQDPNIAMPEKAQEALRYLLECRQKIKPWSFDDVSDISYVIEEVLENKQKRRQLHDLRDDYLQFIEVREEWGDFKFPSVEELGGFYLWFYIIPQNQLSKLEDCSYPWQVVAEKQGRCYVIVLCEHEPTKMEVPFKRVRSGYKSLSQLRKELNQVEKDLDQLQVERLSLTRWIDCLGHHLNAIVDDAELSKTKCQVTIENGLCYIVGWVPENLVPLLHDFSKQYSLTYFDEPVPETAEPPTLLQTHPVVSGAKQAVEFFQTPAYRTWDPSLVVFVSFNLFFAMILSDAGYACLCAALTFLYRKKLRDKSLGVYRLIQSLTGSALVWGVMVGSYFGFSPSPNGILEVLKVVDLNDFDAMIQLSMGVGVLHLVIANLSSGYARKNRWRALGDFGWAIAFVSGFTWFIWDMGRIGLTIGLLLVFLFSSERSSDTAKNIMWRILDGLKALTGFSKGFGDVLSYMRLFALGLSSAQLAITFNGIAADVRAEVPGIGVLLGFLILLLGHLLNFALGIMGGVIHGLRLNLIEFLNWGVKSEGYPFKPFAKQEDNRWKQ